MRTLPTALREAFEADPRVFAGDNAVTARVIIQPDWLLNTALLGLGALDLHKRPVHWFQDADDSGTWIELPRPLTTSRDKGTDNPAPTFEFVIPNWKMDDFMTQTLPGQFGDFGYYWPLRGLSDESRGRWNQARNDWYQMILQNVLVRVYQGIVGPDPSVTLDDAIAGGYVIRRFTGMIDSVNGGTDGKMTIKCRGTTGPLLVDQQMVVPLIPLPSWPMTRQRWVIKNAEVNARAHDIMTGGDETPGDRRAVFSGSDVDAWYPGGGVGSGSPGDAIPDGGFSIHGHRGADAFDGNDDTFYLGVGNSGPTKPFAFDWIECESGGEAVNDVFVNPVWGNYIMFVSVMEHGVWQGTDVIPYDPSELFDTQPYAVNTGAAIPYVAQYTVPWETPNDYFLPRVYAADRVRITFTNLMETEWGPWFFRVGVRQFTPRFSNSPNAPMGGALLHIPPAFLSADRHPDNGYVTVDQFGEVDALGAARRHPPLVSTVDNQPTIAIRMTRTGRGYYTLHNNGVVYAHGDAVHYGDLVTGHFLVDAVHQATDICLTTDGTGYWIAQSTGEIHGFGSVAGDSFTVSIPDQSILFSIDSRDDKLWACDTAGRVTTFRGAPDYGDFAPVLTVNDRTLPGLRVVCIRATSDANGYWLTCNNGAVHARGSAPDAGSMTELFTPDGDWRNGLWEMITLPEGHGDDGYMLLAGDGKVFPIGDIPDGDYYPGPASGVDQQRFDGDYKDLCCDEETEILTKRGWLRWDEVVIGDETLAINPETGCSEWSTVRHVFAEHRTNLPMRHLHGQRHSSLTTYEHRWWCFNPNRGWHWRTTDLLDNLSNIPMAAPPTPSPVKLYADDFVELAAWYWTEGCLEERRGQRRVSFSQSERANPENVARIEALLTRWCGPGGDLRDPTNGWSMYVRDDHLRQYRLAVRYRDQLLRAVQGHEKIVSNEFLTALTSDQLDLFIDVSIAADGHVRSNSTVLAQRSEARIRQFEIACALAGRPFRTSEFKRDGKSMWSTSIHKNRMTAPVAAAAHTHGPAVDEEVKYTGMIWCPTTDHRNWFARRKGTAYFTGNSDIVTDIVRWAGYTFFENIADGENATQPAVFGTVETTGTWVNDPLNSDFFDKRPCIDVINELAQIVNYLVGESEDGGFYFRSPNIWESGNFDEDRNHTDEIPEIDERRDLTQMGVTLPAAPIRSPITIGSSEIDPAHPEQVKHVTYTPPWAGLLHGMIRPLEWTYGAFRDLTEMQIMAELISLRIWLQLRVSSIDAWMNPAIEPDDQVRPLERTTSDTFIYWVSSMHDTMDLQQGTWTMTLTGNWMGTADQWVITADAVDQSGPMPERFGLSEELATWLRARHGASSVSTGGRNLLGDQGDQVTTATANPTGGSESDGAGPP